MEAVSMLRLRLLVPVVVAVCVVAGIAFGAGSPGRACACGGATPPSAPTAAEKLGCGNEAERDLEYPCDGVAVNDASGDLFEQQTDASIGGRGPGLRVTRSYNSLAAVEAKEVGPWGLGWTGPWDAHLTLNAEAETATVEQEGGNSVVFYTSANKYVPAKWVEAKLAKEGSSYVYTLPDQTKLEFNSEGRLTKETDRDGNAITLTYNIKHQLELATDGDNRKLTFKYTEAGQVENVTDPMNHVIKYSYSSGNLLSVTIEGKVQWEFEYEPSHLMKKIIDGRKDATTTEFDASHRVIKQVIAGHERKWKYGAEPGTETKITEPNGSETLQSFNVAGEATKVTAASGASEEAVTEYEYNGTYELEKLLDPDQHATKYTYDSEGNRKTETDANNNETKWEYDTTHDVIKETTPDGETTTIKRNGDGNPEEVSRTIEGKTQKTTYKYNSENQDLLEETNPIEGTTKYTYDGAGDLESETDPDGDKRTVKDNEDSQITSEVSPRGNVEGAKAAEFTTTIERDEQGRPTMVTDPLGHLTLYKYDGDGDIETETDGNNHTTTFLYNEEALPLATHEADGNTVETGYDAEGEMTSRTDGNDHTWEYKRNKLEEITTELNPLLQKTVKTYDKAGNLETVEDPEKHTITYKYDPGNRVLEVKYSTGKPSTVKYEYNKDGAVTKMTDETGETVNAYDAIDRLTESKNGAGKLVKYEYNLANEPTLITYPNSNVVKRAYDKAGRLESVTDWNGKETKFLYNADGELTTTHFPTGTESKDEYAYNDADQLREIKVLKGASTLASLIYGRDDDGQVEHILSKGLPGAETIDSTYDASNRLKKYGANAFEYDKANNPTEIEGKAGYKYNNADQLTLGPEETKYAYNELGQRTKLEPKTGEPTLYTYDQQGNLTAVKQGTSIEDSYTYDGNDLRQTQTIKGTKTNLVWDTAEELPLLLLDETNSYIYGPENVPIEQISESGETSYLHHDQQGSTRLITNTKGENVGAYTYTPYGAVEEHTGTATTPLGYDGQYTNTSTGLIYLEARTYDPKTAQFLSVDPALTTTGAPYTYAEDNPLNAGDPSGEQAPPPLCPPQQPDVNSYLGPGFPLIDFNPPPNPGLGWLGRLIVGDAAFQCMADFHGPVFGFRVGSSGLFGVAFQDPFAVVERHPNESFAAAFQRAQPVVVIQRSYGQGSVVRDFRAAGMAIGQVGDNVRSAVREWFEGWRPRRRPPPPPPPPPQ
jgi:RHS repeat-associated protein